MGCTIGGRTRGGKEATTGAPPAIVEPMPDSCLPTGDGAARAGLTPAPPTASPCIKVCRLDAQDRCYGCGRTRAEIAGWSVMSPEERRAVNTRLGFRGHGANR
jgi:predicted Fe-S protein YdhL (DUF1289 family)